MQAINKLTLLEYLDRSIIKKFNITQQVNNPFTRQKIENEIKILSNVANAIEQGKFDA